MKRLFLGLSLLVSSLYAAEECKDLLAEAWEYRAVYVCKDAESKNRLSAYLNWRRSLISPRVSNVTIESCDVKYQSEKNEHSGLIGVEVRFKARSTGVAIHIFNQLISPVHIAQYNIQRSSLNEARSIENNVSTWTEIKNSSH